VFNPSFLGTILV